MTVLLRIVRGTVATALMSTALAAFALPAGAQGIPMVTSAKAAANKAAAASNAQTAAMQNTNAASPANPAKPSTGPANTTTSVTSVRTTTVTGFSAPPQAPQQHQPAKSVASSASASAMKPVVSVGSAPGHASVSATATAVPAAKAAPAVPGAAPFGDSAGKSISVTQRGTRGEVSLNREVFSYDAGARRDPFVSLMRSGELRPMLSDLRLVVVLYDPTGRNSVAIMHDLSTKDQYRVRVGQTVGRMRVAQIQPKQVVFTVEEVGFSRQEALALGDTTKARMQ
jgi:hypothetical protein